MGGVCVSNVDRDQTGLDNMTVTKKKKCENLIKKLNLPYFSIFEWQKYFDYKYMYLKYIDKINLYLIEHLMY